MALQRSPLTLAQPSLLLSQHKATDRLSVSIESKIYKRRSLLAQQTNQSRLGVPT
ncbi:MAG: hypothetical protein RM338_24490 [Nostoc sp. DedQUE12a]|nr:hypothetical protein [Nostoc sp. DedQUE12a]